MLKNYYGIFYEYSPYHVSRKLVLAGEFTPEDLFNVRYEIVKNEVDEVLG